MPSKSMSLHEKEEKNNVELTELVASDPLEDAALLSSSVTTATAGDDPSPPPPGRPSGRFQTDSLQEQRQATLLYARRLLYVSHLFAQFSEVSWQFCLTIFLAALFNYQSLFLVATYGLTTGTAVTLLGSTMGSLVDRTNRLVAARGFILTENICVILATLGCFQLLSQTTNDDHVSDSTNEDKNDSSSRILSNGSSIMLIIGIHILGAAARVLDEGFLVSIERDWVVVMSQFVKGSHDDSSTKNVVDDNLQQVHSRAWLSETNVAMKQIDLSCKLAAPAISGFLIAMVDNRSSSHPPETADTTSTSQEINSGSQFRYAALAVGAINVLSLLVEYYCTTVIYHCIPDLAYLKRTGQDNDDGDGDDESEEKESSALPITNANWGWASILPYGPQVYLQQKTAFAGIGLAML